MKPFPVKGGVIRRIPAISHISQEDYQDVEILFLRVTTAESLFPGERFKVLAGPRRQRSAWLLEA